MYGLADGGLFGLLALGQLLVERTAHDARRHYLRVAQLPGLMDRRAGQAEVRDGRDIPGWNIPFALAAMALNFAPLLRGVVLVGQPALGLGLDFCGVRHRPVGCCSEVWCGSAPERRNSATYARATTYGRLFAARQVYRPMLWDGDGVAVLQPSQGRFLPRLRAAPSAVAFFVLANVIEAAEVTSPRCRRHPASANSSTLEATVKPSRSNTL